MSAIDSTVAADIADRALRRGIDLGYEHGFRMAQIEAQKVIFKSLPFEQAKALSEKLMALKPDVKS